MTIKLSKGNKKLVSNSDTRFLIFSLPPISTCPYATEHCKHFCYAMKSWKAYPNVREAWGQNFEASKKQGFAFEMIQAIKSEIKKPKYTKAKSIVFRIHESGDYYNQNYTDKWLSVAWYFYSERNNIPNANKITFISYTKSVEFFKGKRLPHNMVIRFSLWDDTEPSQLAIANELGLPIYTAVERFTDEPKIERCGCVDCAKCTKCWQKSISMIKCEIH